MRGCDEDLNKQELLPSLNKTQFIFILNISIGQNYSKTEYIILPINGKLSIRFTNEY